MAKDPVDAVKRGLGIVVHEHSLRGLWVTALVVALGLSLFSQLLLIRTSRAPVPYIVEVDPLGRSMALGPVEALEGELENRVVASVLQGVLLDLRSLSHDPREQNRRLLKALEFLRGDALVFVERNFAKESPLQTGMEFARDLELRSVLQVPDLEGRWEVEWTETLYRRRGGEGPDVTSWKASVVVVVEPPETEEELLKNPFGVYLTGLVWTKRFKGEEVL